VSRFGEIGLDLFGPQTDTVCAPSMPRASVPTRRLCDVVVCLIVTDGVARGGRFPVRARSCCGPSRLEFGPSSLSRRPLPCLPQMQRNFVIVYRCSLCLWFAIAGYVVAMWADVTNQRGSRESRTLWRVYVAAITVYVLLVPTVTIVAFEATSADHHNRTLLIVPDMVRMMGEVGILGGLLYSGWKIWLGYWCVRVTPGATAVVVSLLVVVAPFAPCCVHPFPETGYALDCLSLVSVHSSHSRTPWSTRPPSSTSIFHSILAVASRRPFASSSSQRCTLWQWASSCAAACLPVVGRSSSRRSST
jgi:hypothetical protein